MTGFKTKDIQDFELKNRDISRKAAADGMVLLKNDGTLPLKKGSSIALYGAGAAETAKGGLGSGDVNSRKSVTLWEGLRNAGFRIVTEDWLQDYEQRYEKARIAWRDDLLRQIDERAKNGEYRSIVFFDIYPNNPFVPPEGKTPEKEDSNVAMYAIMRSSTEGADRRLGKGDYYLSDSEKRDLDAITRLYEKVVIVLNAGGIVDMSFLDEYDNISAVLLMGQAGGEGGNAAADIISGKAVPSGKLTDTWALKYEDYPSSAAFSSNDGNVDTEKYEEGIYVGYRYFDTYDVPVRYCFGYGLSYAFFSIKPGTIRAERSTGTERPLKFAINASVTNNGIMFSGRDTVQVYVSCPQDEADREFRKLVGFTKTAEIEPGKSAEVEVRFTQDDLARFDEEKSGWVLDSGDYIVYVGDSLDSAVPAGMITLKGQVTACSTEHICPLDKSGQLSELHGAREMSLKKRKRDIETLKDEYPNNCIEINAEDLYSEKISYEPAAADLSDKAMETAEKLTKDQAVLLAVGDISGINEGGEPLLPGAAAQTSACALEMGVPSSVLADGPAGLRIAPTFHVKDGKAVREPFEKMFEGGLFYTGKEDDGEIRYQPCTCFPIGTMLAQSFDPELIEEVGRAVSRELEIYGVTFWLAPGMNIHRNPLCGRNFEYYSENPLVSGTAAAAITRGVQECGTCGTTIKHFACNNQESNRNHTDSVVSERALREIYLKGFEIAVKTAQPLAIMTSYNKINGVHSANNYDLCTKAARCEWGFKGIIMTDWTTTIGDPECTAQGCMKAGNDLIMPGSQEDIDSIKEGLSSGSISIEDVRRSAGRLIQALIRTRRM
ncbi:MAG: glycoside hydrolase family 3 protein [Oscillospiraceae bacterium]|jgi:beta-glucosidase